MGLEEWQCHERKLVDGRVWGGYEDDWEYHYHFESLRMYGILLLCN